MASKFSPKKIKDFNPSGLNILTFNAGFKKKDKDLLLIIFDKIIKELIMSKIISQKKIDFSGMFMSAGIAIGFVIGYMPFNVDANFRHALELGDSDKIHIYVNKWPTDSARYL